ncbi:energy-coupling factor ABC transporter substrate-binding protein [Anaerovorax odorimutans]|uniref:Cobalt transport protein CbiN n=1 Tax=Anaerovorax odorimutans TaxID=109327 RepID=A0ABT1RMH2_9FIRM|nr:energy-coupling factor ABC transporter substrate-binding protein [Anaerovorax odorimutans]MCQ4636384.1 energy-coupling factor ABC transporter substrate-binding protein [Anaerovorax odorimutans]
MTKNMKIVIICLVLAALIAVVPLLFIHDSEFGGADGAAEEAIAAIDPDYEAWADPLIEPPGGETESLLFCLQAALGGGVFGFGMGYLICRKKYSKKEQE